MGLVYMFIFVWYIEEKNERVNTPMGINRVELKERSRDLIARSKPQVLLVGLIYIILGLIMYLLSSRLLGINYTDTLKQLYTQYLESGNVEYAMAVAARMAPPIYAVALSWVTDFLMYIVGAGFVLFLLNTIRRAGASYGNLLDAFPLFFKLFLLSLLTSVFTFLWSLLLIFPGVIAAYRYRQALYILLDHPEKSPLQCIRESKELMRGHKWELFVLDLSFIGWSLLASIPYVGYIIQVWTVPYIDLSYALYYEKLSGGDIYAADGRDELPPPPIGY